MARYSFSPDGSVLLVRTDTRRGAEAQLMLCGLGFILFGFLVAAVGFPTYGGVFVLFGLVGVAALFQDTRLRVERRGDLRVQHTLFGWLPLAGRTFTAGTWKLNVVGGRDDWNPDGPKPWHFVIRGARGRCAVPYAFLRKQGAVRLRQRILAWVQDGPF